MRFLLPVFVFILQLSDAYSQFSISGSVSDSTSGDKIPGATVFIPELHKGTVSGADGKYFLGNLPQGIFKIQYSYVGYEAVIKNVALNQDLVLDVALETAVIETHEIVVTAMYAAPQDETPVKVDQLSRDQMNKSGSISLTESISTIPGISSLSTGTGIGKPVIRGLSGNRVVVYSQGIRIENQQWGSEHGLGVSDMGIERVEIVKGPASLLYGSDAMGGALNMVDESPAYVGSISGDYRLKAFSNTLGISNGFGVKGSGKTGRFNLRANSQSHADYTDGNYRRVGNTRFNEREIKGSAGFTRSRMVSNSTYNFINSEIGIPQPGSAGNTVHAITEPWQGIQSHIVSTQNSYFSGKSKFKTNLGYLNNTRREYEKEQGKSPASPAEEPALDMRLNTLNYDVRWQYDPSDKGEFVLGLQGMRQTNKNYGEESLVPDARVYDIGIIGLGHYHLEKTVFQLGARFDKRQLITEDTNPAFAAFKREFRSTNASAGGVYNASRSFLLRFNVATGFRAPNLSELSSNGVHHGTNRYETGNNTLKKEQNLQVDFSSHYHSKHVSIDIAAFHNTIRDFIFISPTGSMAEGYFVYNYLQDNARLYGGEFGMDVHPHPLDWLHLESNFSLVIGKLKSGDYLPLMPANKMNHTIVIEVPDNNEFPETFFRIGITNVSAQRNTAPEERASGAYNLISFGVGSKIKIGKQLADFSFTVTNLLNEKYTDHLSRLKPHGIYNTGRNMVIQVNVPLGIKSKNFS